MFKKIIFLGLLFVGVAPAVLAQGFSTPFGTQPEIAINTDCSGFTTDGKLCWDSDDDVLYVGNGTTAELVPAGLASALAANGANCSAGSYPLGVDASGAVEDCTAALTEAGAKTVGINSHTDATVVLTAADCYGDINLNGDDDAIDFTLPAAAAGLACCFDANGFAQVITVDTADGTDSSVLGGTALTAGNAIDTIGSEAEQFCLVGRDDSTWIVYPGSAYLADGGAD